MRYPIIYKTYAFAVLMAFVVSACLRRLAPEASLHVSVFDAEFVLYYSFLWIGATFYFAAQAIGCFLLSRSGLRLARWKVLLHVMFSVLFLFFFVIFNLISGSACQHLFSKLGIPFWTDLRLFVFFLTGSFAALVLQLLFFSGVLIAVLLKTRPYKPGLPA